MVPDSTPVNDPEVTSSMYGPEPVIDESVKAA
jgi:hypothetical protein